MPAKSPTLLYSVPLLLFSSIAPAQSLPSTLFGGSFQASLVLALVIVQIILIIVLLRSRAKHKNTELDIKSAQKDLEQRVTERTNKLRAINNQLYEEIAKHEITEELLQETQDYLHSMINSMPSILIGLTREGIVTQWNTAAERNTGINAREALGKNVVDIAPELGIDLTKVKKAIDTNRTQLQEAVQHENDGEIIHTDSVIYPLISSEVVGAVIRIDDVTMRVRFENMMIQNEKMMSLGELAAGMAHEINNPLSAILHGVQNIYRRTSPDIAANLETAKRLGVDLDSIQSYLKERGIYKFIDGIKESGERSAHIVTNMLEFSRSSNQKHEYVNIVNLVEHSLELVANSLQINTVEGKKNLLIEKEYQSDLPSVPCSAAEIQQVLLNIFRNAAQAFPSSHLQEIQTPQLKIKLHNDAEWLVIEIVDNGAGMNDSTRRHIFEPFFTTKEVGKGTGLGLSVSYFIITEHHDGKITVESAEGIGTTFRISLPLEKANYS